MFATLASLSEETFLTHFPLTDQTESCGLREKVVRVSIIIIIITWREPVSVSLSLSSSQYLYLERASSLLNKLKRMSLREAFIKL